MFSYTTRTCDSLSAFTFSQPVSVCTSRQYLASAWISPYDGYNANGCVFTVSWSVASSNGTSDSASATYSPSCASGGKNYIQYFFLFETGPSDTSLQFTASISTVNSTGNLWFVDDFAIADLGPLGS